MDLFELRAVCTASAIDSGATGPDAVVRIGSTMMGAGKALEFFAVLLSSCVFVEFSSGSSSPDLLGEDSLSLAPETSNSSVASSVVASADILVTSEWSETELTSTISPLSIANPLVLDVETMELATLGLLDGFAVNAVTEGDLQPEATATAPLRTNGNR